MLNLEKREGTVVELRASGKIRKGDYDHVAPQLEHIIDTQGKLRALIVLENFEGWTAGGLADDFQFHVRHRKDFAKAAVVGDRRWQRGALRLVRPFVAGDLRFFASGQEEEARRWLAS